MSTSKPAAGTSKPKMPTGLGAAGRRLWRSITETWTLDGRERELLIEAARCLDLAEQLDAKAAAEGLTASSARGGPVLHPGIDAARRQRLAAARLLSTLDLPGENDGPAQTFTAQHARRSARARWAKVREERRGGCGGCGLMATRRRVDPVVIPAPREIPAELTGRCVVEDWIDPPGLVESMTDARRGMIVSTLRRGESKPYRETGAEMVSWSARVMASRLRRAEVGRFRAAYPTAAVGGGGAPEFFDESEFVAEAIRLLIG